MELRSIKDYFKRVKNLGSHYVQTKKNFKLGDAIQVRNFEKIVAAIADGADANDVFVSSKSSSVLSGEAFFVKALRKGCSSQITKYLCASALDSDFERAIANLAKVEEIQKNICKQEISDGCKEIVKMLKDAKYNPLEKLPEVGR